MNRKCSKPFLSLWIFFSIVFFSFLPVLVQAQSLEGGISINILPVNPSPFEETTIVLSSYANNLDSVLITWTVDGKKILSGVGQKSFSLKAPAAGGESNVVATVDLPSGTLESRVLLRPSIMTMLWQANDSYVPPFYRGKALTTPESEIKVVAMPEVKSSNGGLVSPKTMTYYWKKNYLNDQEGSGYGKNSFIYKSDYLEDSNSVGVTASTIDGRNSTEKTITITSAQPEIVFYKDTADMGTIWDNAIVSPHRLNGEEILVGVPYFLSPKNLKNPVLSLNWFINDSPVTISGLEQNIIPLKVEEGTSGTSKLRLDVENRFKIFQNLSKEIEIQF